MWTKGYHKIGCMGASKSLGLSFLWHYKSAEHGSVRNQVRLFGEETYMGDANAHLKKFSELSKNIEALGKSVRKAEKNARFQWVDEIEKIDLEDIKEHMKKVEDSLRMLQAEIGHLETEHLNR